jgi:Protein of unknown function (DUF2510)
MYGLVGLILLGVVTWLVVRDASQLRQQEIAAFGVSRVDPGMWGVGVFLLLIVFLPWYLIWRSGVVKRLMRLCPHCMKSVSVGATTCPYCRNALPGSGSSPEKPAVELPPPAPFGVRPGWLADPTGQHEQRYWDGASWTDQTRDFSSES